MVKGHSCPSKLLNACNQSRRCCSLAERPGGWGAHGAGGGAAACGSTSSSASAEPSAPAMTTMRSLSWGVRASEMQQSACPDEILSLFCARRTPPAALSVLSCNGSFEHEHPRGARPANVSCRRGCPHSVEQKHGPLCMHCPKRPTVCCTLPEGEASTTRPAGPSPRGPCPRPPGRGPPWAELRLRASVRLVLRQWPCC